MLKNEDLAILFNLHALNGITVIFVSQNEEMGQDTEKDTMVLDTKARSSSF